LAGKDNQTEGKVHRKCKRSRKSQYIHESTSSKPISTPSSLNGKIKRSICLSNENDKQNHPKGQSSEKVGVFP